MNAADALAALDRTRRRLVDLYGEAVKHRAAHPNAQARKVERNIAEEISAVDASMDRWCGKPILEEADNG